MLGKKPWVKTFKSILSKLYNLKREHYHVKLKSSVLKEELKYEKLKVIKLINNELRKRVHKRI